MVSLFTSDVKTTEEAIREWTKLRDIDNPLHPWSQLYVEDIPGLAPGEKPSQEKLDGVFRKARIAAYIGGAVTFALVVIIVPSVMLSLNVLTMNEFKVWTHVLQIFCFSMAAIVIIVAPVEEVMQICRQYNANKASQRQNHVGNYAYDMNETNHE